jgi:hypothetical protein
MPSHWGLTYAEPKIELDKLRTFKDSVVGKLTGGLGQLSKQRKITYIQGKATFIDAKTLSIEAVTGGGASIKGTGKTQALTFDNAIIATGSYPTKIPGLSLNSDRVMDSTGALDLPEIPGTLLVVGGGYIGLELGSVYAALGTKVTVVEMTDGCCRAPIGTSSRTLRAGSRPRCTRFCLKTRVTGMEEAKKGVKVLMEGEGLADADKAQVFDRVLVSIGRRPNSAVPGLDKTGREGQRQGLHPGGCRAADRHAEHLCDWRRGGRADARAQGVTLKRVWRGSDHGSTRWRSSRRRFPPWSSPIPKSPGAASPKPSEEAGPQGGDRQVPLGRARPRRWRSIGRRASPSW